MTRRAGPPRGTDARTTPPERRPLVYAGLGTMLAYLLVCFYFSIASLGVVPKPTALAAMEPLFFLGRWRMFTDLRTTHKRLDVEVDGKPVDVDALYPNHWDEGPGYLRDEFLQSRERLAGMVADVCARVGGHDVKLVRVRWPKHPGQVEQPREDEERTLVYEGACGG